MKVKHVNCYMPQGRALAAPGADEQPADALSHGTHVRSNQGPALRPGRLYSSSLSLRELLYLSFLLFPGLPLCLDVSFCRSFSFHW
jgi:hypothetical protein